MVYMTPTQCFLKMGQLLHYYYFLLSNLGLKPNTTCKLNIFEVQFIIFNIILFIFAKRTAKSGTKDSNFNQNLDIMGFLKDFKAFAMKGNVIDMAVGVIIGGAFGKIVTSLVNDIIMPLIGTAMGGVDFKEAKHVLKEAIMDGETVVKPEVVLTYGNFIQTVVDFLIIALSIFVAIRVITKLTEKRKKEEAAAAAPAPAPAPQPSAEEKLLTEIRDLLKEKK